ncbi:MAG: hypothetical protein KJ044_15135, partial [Planctomycetes bacterium]|nr:hypothetical protein [Planctomycetota bacterium]
IKPRQWVAGPTRPLGTVAGVRHIEAPGTRVYNFGVDGTRTYFVSGTTVCGQPMPVWVHNTHRRTSKAPEGTSVRVGKNGGEMPAEHAKIVAEREKRRAEQRNKKARECNGQNAQGSKKEKGQKGPSGVMPEEARKKKQEAQQRERNVGIDEEHSRRTKNNPGAGAKR